MFSTSAVTLKLPPLPYQLPKSHHRCRRFRFRRFPFSVPPSSLTLQFDWFSPNYRSWGGDGDEEVGEEGEEKDGFGVAVVLFNEGDYYRCHDVLEELWNKAEEPVRTLVHGILQCAVGFHHLFSQNHRGAMMELGEGLCKLRKMDFHDGPFLQFEKEISLALDFLYQTQKELAACTDDLCLTMMDGSKRTYQLLGSFAAGQKVYTKMFDPHGVSYIVFCPKGNCSLDEEVRVKLPILHASEEHLTACGYL